MVGFEPVRDLQHLIHRLDEMEVQRVEDVLRNVREERLLACSACHSPR